MNAKLSAFLILFFLLLGIAGCTGPGNSTQSATLNLFNGKDLDGWYTYIRDRGRDVDPKKVFSVHDGLLRISGEEWGCVTTKDEYADYKLLAEFKWGTLTFGTRANKAMDNGILIHSVGPDGAYDGVWMNSIECQLIEGGTGDLLVVGNGTQDFSLTCPVAREKQNGSYIFQPDGNLVTINGGRINWFGRDESWKDEKGFRGKSDVEKPVGEWNRIECIAKGDSITILLNDVLVNQGLNVKPRKGKIQIQSEGAEIFFRRIELTKINTK